VRPERGSALVVVVFALFLAIVIGAAALADTVGALRATDHQRNVKRAQQAADAAIDAAIYGLNRLALVDSLDIDPLDPATVTDQSCVVATSGGAALDLVPLPPLSSWCPESAGELGEGATWSFRVSQVARVGGATCGDGSLLSLDRRIVAVGVSRGVQRRVAATLRAPVSLFSGAAVQSGATSTPLRLSGGARVAGDVHANASITGTGGAPVITGNATAGPGGSVSGVVPAGVSGVGCHRFALPAVDQATAPADNDNAALDGDDGQSGDCLDHALGLLPVLCDPPLLPPTGGFDWDPGERTLRVWGNGVFRLPGDTYSFCSIRLEGQGILLLPPGAANTRVFLDAPENCDPSIAGRGQITADGLSRIVNCHPQTQPETLQLYAVGSASAGTVQTLAGGGALNGSLLGALCGVNLPLVGTPMVLYAPRSQVTLAGSASIAGLVAANVVELSGAATVTSVNSLVNLDELGSKPVLPLYRPQNYVSCTSRSFAELPADDPALGC
jgi:hypothetical protein